MEVAQVSWVVVSAALVSVAVVFAAAVSRPVVVVLARVFVVVAGSVADAAVPFVVFWPGLLAQPHVHVPVLAAAVVSGAPVPASRAVAPALAGAVCPWRGSSKVGPQVEEQVAVHLDELAEPTEDDPSAAVEPRCSESRGARRDGPADD